MEKKSACNYSVHYRHFVKPPGAFYPTQITSIETYDLTALCFSFCRFISYCVKEKGYTGFDLSDAEGEDDIVSRLVSLKINVDSECQYSQNNGQTVSADKVICALPLCQPQSK